MKLHLFIDILLLIGVVYLSSCSNSKRDYVNNPPFDINYYTDTINGHEILTTVVIYNDKISSTTTIELK